MADHEHQHLFANPLPAGLGALAIACFGFYAVLSGSVTHEAAPILAVWLIGGFIVQVVVALIEFRDKNLPGANVFLVFAGFFMLTGAMSLFTKYFLHAHGMPFDGRIEGWMWIPTGVWLLMMVPCFLKSPRMLFFLGLLLVIIVGCLVALDMGVVTGRAAIARFASWTLLLSGIIALYLSGAVAINGHLGKEFLPITTPLMK